MHTFYSHEELNRFWICCPIWPLVKTTNAVCHDLSFVWWSQLTSTAMFSSIIWYPAVWSTSKLCNCNSSDCTISDVLPSIAWAVANTPALTFSTLFTTLTRLSVTYERHTAGICQGRKLLDVEHSSVEFIDNIKEVSNISTVSWYSKTEQSNVFLCLRYGRTMEVCLNLNEITDVK